jgi:hypothetical protein
MPVISTDINDVIVHLVIREYIMFQFSRIFVTLWFRHQETTAPAMRHSPGAAPLPGATPQTGYIDTETGLHVCGIKGCEEAFEKHGQMKTHQEFEQRIGGKVNLAHAKQLFVYLPHYLVFNTYIVISVNVPRAIKLFRM